jgi:hypothetical protein
VRIGNKVRCAKSRRKKTNDRHLRTGPLFDFNTKIKPEPKFPIVRVWVYFQFVFTGGRGGVGWGRMRRRTRKTRKTRRTRRRRRRILREGEMVEVWDVWTINEKPYAPTWHSVP